MTTVEYARAYESPSPYSGAHVSDGTLKTLDFIGVVLAVVMTLGPLAAAFVQSGSY
jgi:hypothetical protein